MNRQQLGEFEEIVMLAVGILYKEGAYAIAIVGLAVGLATFSLIAFYVYHELSFDRYHEKANRIFRRAARVGLAPGGVVCWHAAGAK